MGVALFQIADIVFIWSTGVADGILRGIIALCVGC